MIWAAIPAIVMQVLASADASGDEYLLTVQTVGYRAEVNTDDEPQETVLQSLETVVKPGSTFHVKFKSSKEITTLKGKFHDPIDDVFKVDINYVFTLRGEAAGSGQAGRESNPDQKSSVSTTVSIERDGKVILGGLQTKQVGTFTDETGKTTETKSVSKIFYWLTLKKIDPNADSN